MPPETLTVRLNERERELLTREGNARGLGPSAWARVILRRHLGLDPYDEDQAKDAEQLEALERRLARLEEMAGL